MAADRILMLKLLGDTSSMDKSLRKSEGRMKSFGRTVAKWGTAVVADLAITGVEKLADAIGDAWTGFREGEKASAQLGTTWRNLGLDGSKLSGTIDRISDSTLKLGTDDTEAIMAFNRALQNTGGKPAEAMKRLRIAQDLVANGSAPNLNSALKLVSQAAKGSARVVDQFGLKSKTAGGRVDELGRKVKGAAKRKADLDPLGVLFNRINEDLEGIVGSLSKGELDDALKSFGQIGTDLSGTWDKVSPAVTTVVDKLTGGAFSDIIRKLQDLGAKYLPGVRQGFEDLGSILSGIQPHIQNALAAIQPLVDAFSTSVSGGLGFVLSIVNGFLAITAALVRGNFSQAFDAAKTAVEDMLTAINDVFLGLPGKIIEWGVDILAEAGGLGSGIATSIMTGVSAVPGKIWDALVGGDESVVNKLKAAADEALKAAGSIGKGIYDGIVGAVKALVVKVAQLWNSLGSFGAGGFTFAEAFSIDIMGQKIGWPRIAVEWGAGDIIPNIDVPALAKGGVVSRPTLAVIGEAGPEAVVPLGRGGGMGTTINLTVNVLPGADPAEVGRRVVAAIKAYERRDGRGWRAA